MKLFNYIKTRIFNSNIEKERIKAQKLYDIKSDTVICKYCKQLIKKQEAGSVYCFQTKELEFFHEDCFNKNEHIGTLEDLEKMI